MGKLRLTMTADPARLLLCHRGHRVRSLLLAAIAGLLAVPAPACAEEPLFLRIRPNGSDSPGSPDRASDEALAARARAMREAVWTRSDTRARIAIASVCTGCLKPMPGATVRPAGRRDASDAVPQAAGIYAFAPSASDPSPALADSR